MLRFILGRLVGAIIVLWVIVTLSFFLMRFAPGSPFDEDRRLPPNVEANKWITYGMGVELTAPAAGRVVDVGVAPNTVDDGVHALGAPVPVQQGRDYEEGQLLCAIETADGARVAVAMATAGRLVAFPCAEVEAVVVGQRLAVVPKPLWAQYTTALVNYAQLEFGQTISSDGTRSVAENLWRGLPISLELGLWALLVALLLGVSAGLYAGLKPNTWGDYTVMSLSMIGISVPTIVTGPLLIAVFVVGLELLPFGGWGTWQHKILPVMTLGLVYTAAFARLTRGGMLEVIGSDYIRTARAKGLDERTVVLRHALKGALLPTVSFLGPAVASIVTGSLVVERVFIIPGLSEYFITPALYRDYPMVIGVVVLYSTLLIAMNLLVDIAYTWLDPRVSYD